MAQFCSCDECLFHLAMSYNPALRVAVPLMPYLVQPPPPPYSTQRYLPNGTISGPTPGAQALLPNQGRIIQSGPIRVLCIADVRGKADCRVAGIRTDDAQAICAH